MSKSGVFTFASSERSWIVPTTARFASQRSDLPVVWIMMLDPVNVSRLKLTEAPAARMSASIVESVAVMTELPSDRRIPVPVASRFREDPRVAVRRPVFPT